MWRLSYAPNQIQKGKIAMARKTRLQLYPQEENRIREFLDMFLPPVVKCNTEHFICGNTYRCVWA
jgi:hypothetical protein